MSGVEFTLVKPRETRVAFYERVRSRRLASKAKLERTIQRVQENWEFHSRSHVLAVERWARAGAAGEPPAEDGKVGKLASTLVRLRAALVGLGKETKREFQLRWSVKAARISRQAALGRYHERMARDRYNRFACLNVEPAAHFMEYDGPIEEVQPSRRSLLKAQRKKERYESSCVGPFLGLKRKLVARPRLKLVELLERSFWAHNPWAHTLTPIVGGPMCFSTLVRDLLVKKLRNEEIVPQMKIPFVSDLLSTMSNINDITRDVKSTTAQMAKVDVDEIVGVTLHNVAEAAKESGLFARMWAVVSNIVHVLISPTWKTAVWSLVSILQSFFNMKWDCIDKVVMWFQKMFLRTRRWANCNDYPSPFTAQQGNARPQMAELDEHDVTRDDGDDDCDPEYSDENMALKHAGAILTIVITCIVTGLGFASTQFKQQGNWASRLVYLTKQFTTTANGLLSFFRGTIDLFKDVYEVIVNKCFPNYESLSFLAKNDEQIYSWAKRAQVLLDHRNRNIVFSNPLRVAELYAAANEACLIQAKLVKCDMGLRATQFGVITKLINDLLRLRDVAAALHVAPPVKFEPFVLQICGKANIGKSFLLNSFTVDLLHQAGYRTYQEPIYVRSPGNAYWNSLANQPICIYDDFMALTNPEFSSVQIAELFQLKTRSVFNPPMAAVDDKTIRYNPIIVGIASNASHYNLSGVLDPDAIHRRRDCLVEMRLKDEFPTINDVPVQVLRNNGHLVFDILDPIDRNRKHETNMTYVAFSEYVQQRFNTYYATETERYKQISKELFKLVPRAGELEFRFEGHETGEALSTYMERFSSKFGRDEKSIKALMKMVTKLSIRKQKDFYQNLGKAMLESKTKLSILEHMVNSYQCVEKMTISAPVYDLIAKYSHIAHSDNAERRRLLRYCEAMGEAVAKSELNKKKKLEEVVGPEVKPQAKDVINDEAGRNVWWLNYGGVTFSTRMYERVWRTAGFVVEPFTRTEEKRCVELVRYLVFRYLKAGGVQNAGSTGIYFLGCRVGDHVFDSESMYGLLCRITSSKWQRTDLMDLQAWRSLGADEQLAIAPLPCDPQFALEEIILDREKWWPNYPIRPQMGSPKSKAPNGLPGNLNLSECRFVDLSKVYDKIGYNPSLSDRAQKWCRARIMEILKLWAKDVGVEIDVNSLSSKVVGTEEFEVTYCALVAIIFNATLPKPDLKKEEEGIGERIIVTDVDEPEPGPSSTSPQISVGTKIKIEPKCIHDKMNLDLGLHDVEWNDVEKEWRIRVEPQSVVRDFPFYPQELVVDGNEGHYIATPHAPCELAECPWLSKHGRSKFIKKFISENTYLTLCENSGDREGMRKMIPMEYWEKIDVNEFSKLPLIEKGFFARLVEKFRELPWYKIFKFFSLVTASIGTLLSVYNFFFKNKDDEPVPQGSNTSDRNKTHSDAPKRASGPKVKTIWEKPIKMSDLVGQMNHNIDDDVCNVVRRNTFFIVMKERGASDYVWKTAARCVGLMDRVAIFPAHYMDVWTAIVNTKRAVQFFYVSNLLTAPVEISIDDLQLSRNPDRSLAFMILPKHLQCFRNIASRFSSSRDEYSRAISSTIYELQARFAGTIRFNLQKTSVKAKLSPGVNVGATGSFRAFRVADSYLYEYGGSGVCGSLLVGDTGRIYGMHVAGSEGRDMGYAEIIGSAEMDRARELAEFRGDAQVDPAILIPDSDDTMGSLCGDRILPAALASVGRVPPSLRNHSPVDTSFRKSPISEDLERGGIVCLLAPAVLSTHDSRICHVISPLLEGVKHHGHPMRPLPSGIVERAMVDYTNMVLSASSPYLAHASVLSRSESVIGIPGNRYIRSLEFTSSSGWPWRCDRSLQAAQKQRWVDVSGFDEGELVYNGCDPELAAVMDIKDRQRREGIIPFTVFADVLKDETVPGRKIRPGGTRVISMSPIDFTIQQRQYTMSFVSAFMHNRLDLEHAIGIDADSSEWTLLLKKICKNGRTKFIAGDYSKFGDRLPVDIGKRCYDLIAKWYAMYLPEDEANLVKQNLAVMAEEVFSPYHIVNDRVYKTMAGMPSGNTVTVVLNSMINSILLRIVWCILTDGTAFAGFEKFYRHVTVFTYGDDMLASVDDEVAHLFNTKTISEVFARYDLQFSDADKSGREVLFRNIGEITFLKRSFRPFSPSEKKMTGIRNLVLAPMDLTTIHSIAHWVKKGSDPEEYALLLSYETLKLAFTRGREDYEKIAEVFRAIWRKRGQHLVVEDWAVLAKRTYISAIPLMEATRKFISMVEVPTIHG